MSKLRLIPPQPSTEETLAVSRYWVGDSMCMILSHPLSFGNWRISPHLLSMIVGEMRLLDCICWTIFIIRRSRNLSMAERLPWVWKWWQGYWECQVGYKVFLELWFKWMRSMTNLMSWNKLALCTSRLHLTLFALNSSARMLALMLVFASKSESYRDNIIFPHWPWLRRLSWLIRQLIIGRVPAMCRLLALCLVDLVCAARRG